jgi:acyl-CoA hydrolase
MMRMEQYRWVQGWCLNSTNILFGGQMLSWVDEDTTMLAYEACKSGIRLTTAAFDRCSFLSPGRQGDRIRFAYSIEHIGNKSMTMLAKVYSRPMGREREDVHLEYAIYECLVTMVSLSGPLKEWLLDDVKVDPTTKTWQLIEKLRKERQSL